MNKNHRKINYQKGATMAGVVTGASFLATIFLVLPILLPPVESLPFGLDPILTTFMNSVNQIIAVLPMMETIWHVFIIAISVKFAMLVISWTWRVIELVASVI